MLNVQSVLTRTWRPIAWAFFLTSIATCASAEEWLEDNAMFYRIKYTKEDATEIPKIKELLESFHRSFLKDSKMADIEFKESDVAIEIHPRTSSTVQVGAAWSIAGIQERNGKSAYVGTVFIPGPTAHDGSMQSTNGHPQDRRYFDKLLIHEVAPVYYSLFCERHGVDFHSSFPDWFTQGIEEYFGVFDSTPYWREQGIQSYYQRLAKNPNTLDTDFGLTIHDPYNDGFLMLNFLHDEFGRDAIFALLISQEPSFGRRLKATTKISFDEYLRRINQWKRRRIDARRP